MARGATWHGSKQVEITLTPAQAATLFALAKHRQELQAALSETAAAMHVLGKHYAAQAGVEGEGDYTVALNMQGPSVVRFAPKTGDGHEGK